MRATLMYAAGDVRVEDVQDPSIVEPTDAIIRITSACICGSDLWPYADLEPTTTGRPMGHEAIGVVEDVGTDVRTIKRGDLVVMPFAFSDGTCAFCHEGLQTACVHGGFFDGLATGAAQAEAVRVPLADGTLFALPVSEDDALMPSLLTLSDVLGTGHHAAVVAGVKPGDAVAVVGDGAVGLCGVIAANRLGAEEIIIMGRYEERTALARELGATDVVAERGEQISTGDEQACGLRTDTRRLCAGACRSPRRRRRARSRRCPSVTSPPAQPAPRDTRVLGPNGNGLATPPAGTEPDPARPPGERQGARSFTRRAVPADAIPAQSVNRTVSRNRWSPFGSSLISSSITTHSAPSYAPVPPVMARVLGAPDCSTARSLSPCA